MLLGIGLCCAVSVAAVEPFPEAPRSTAEAQALGLQRVDAATLAKTYGGVREAQNLKREVTRQELRPDGTLTYTNDAGVSGTGTWSVVDENGGMICRTFDFQGGRRFCTIYYAAQDGVHLFGYNAQDKVWRITTRRVDPR
jgi:hypothetical protein